MKRFLLAVLMVVGVAHFAFAASTTDQLRLTSGGVTITVADNVAPDSNGAAGAINYSNANFDGWNISVAGGATDSPVLNPVGIDIFSLTASCNGGGCATHDLVIEYSDQNFTQTVGAGGFSTFFSASIGAGSASQKAWDDTSNTIFGHGTLIGSLGPFVAPGGSGTVSGGGPAGPAAYSLTLQDTITHGSSVNFVSLDGNITAVPEPSSLVLFGTGLLAFASFAKRKFRKS